MRRWEDEPVGEDSPYGEPLSPLENAVLWVIVVLMLAASVIGR